MVDGPNGRSGVVAVLRVAAVFKHACELARTLPQVVVVLIAKGITYSPKFAIPMVAQVSVS